MNTSSGLQMPMLAIELSQREGGVAVVGEEIEPTVVPVTGGRREKDELLPAVRCVLQSAGVSVKDLGTVAVDVGPGGFTGLRISIAAGQMLAEIAGASIVGIPGAEVAASSTPAVRERALVGTILVIAAIRNGTAWATRLQRLAPGADWRPVGRPILAAGPPQGHFDLVLADEHLEPAWRSHFESQEIEIVEPVHSAGGLADLLRRSMPGSPPDSWHVSRDAATLRPIYPREPEAVRLWKNRSAR